MTCVCRHVCVCVYMWDGVSRITVASWPLECGCEFIWEYLRWVRVHRDALTLNTFWAVQCESEEKSTRLNATRKTGHGSDVINIFCSLNRVKLSASLISVQGAETLKHMDTNRLSVSVHGAENIPPHRLSCKVWVFLGLTLNYVATNITYH